MLEITLLFIAFVLDICSKDSILRGKNKKDGIYRGKGGPRRL
jgi:hypothetical protein